MTMRVAGSVAVVTGASSGIGEATAEALARKGAKVVVVARRRDRLELLVERLRVHGSNGLAVAADLKDHDTPAEVVRRTKQAFGDIDILVNNAGIALHKNSADCTVEEIEEVVDVNFLSAVRMTMAVLPSMLERRRGSVVSITSVAGYLPNPGEAAYSAVKSALGMWTDGLSVDLPKSGVHFGVVSPGPIDTEIWQKGAINAPYADPSHKKYPPSVVANAVVKVIEKELSLRTAPRHYGIPGAMYPMFRKAMLFGLRTAGEKMHKRSARERSRA